MNLNHNIYEGMSHYDHAIWEGVALPQYPCNVHSELCIYKAYIHCIPSCCYVTTNSKQKSRIWESCVFCPIEIFFKQSCPKGVCEVKK